MSLKIEKIGYFGLPGGYGGKIHVTNAAEEPLCKTPVNPGSSFILCIKVGLKAVECKRCLKVLRENGLAI